MIYFDTLPVKYILIGMKDALSETLCMHVWRDLGTKNIIMIRIKSCIRSCRSVNVRVESEKGG